MTLRAAVHQPDVTVFPAATFGATGLSDRDIERIRAILDAYDRTNPSQRVSCVCSATRSRAFAIRPPA